MSTLASIDTTTRRTPRMGGLNATMFLIELRRVLRNRRTLVFSLLLPVALFFTFAGSTGSSEREGVGNISAYIMVSMGVYGAALTASASGATVALERSLGWSRQLRLTPLSPTVYIAVKAVVALVMGAVAVAAVNVAGLIQGKPSMPAGAWVSCALLTVVGTLVFAALGVFVGFLVPGENAMQVIGPGLALLSFLGNVFIPLTEGSVIYHIATYTPMFGVVEIARAPLTHDLPWYAVLNVVVWLTIFVAGAAWRMSKDTARV